MLNLKKKTQMFQKDLDFTFKIVFRDFETILRWAKNSFIYFYW